MNDTTETPSETPTETPTETPSETSIVTAQGVVDSLFVLAEQRCTSPSSQDSSKKLLVLIGYQCSITDPEISILSDEEGIDKLVIETLGYIEKDFNSITRIIPAQRNCFVQQLFFPTMWRNKEGQKPAPGQRITLPSYKDNVWMIDSLEVWHPNMTKEWLEKKVLMYLEQQGDEGLLIQTFSSLHGTYGGSLDSRLNEARNVHSLSRKYPAEAEWYDSNSLVGASTIFGPESSLGIPENERFLRDLANAATVIFAGFAFVKESAERLKKFCETHKIECPTIEEREELVYKPT